MSGQLKILLLSDNHALPGFVSEHGFALLLEIDQRRILFDCGNDAEVLAANADAAGIDLSSIDALILSHGHYDHSGGIPYLLEKKPALPVYCHPGICQKRYSIRDANAKDISVPPESCRALRNLPEGCLHLVDGPLPLSKHILLSGPVPRQTEYEDRGGPFYLDRDGLRADQLEDELFLLCDLDEGIVVCSGCSHSGIINILLWTVKQFPERPILAVIGGFHLGNASPERMQKTIEAMRQLPIKQLIPCHCTGQIASQIFTQEFPEKVSIGAAGQKWEY